MRVNTVINLWHMMALRVSENTCTVRDTAGLGVGGAIIKPRNPRVADRRRAHGTGFQRDVKIVSGQPFLPQCGTGRADRKHLGVCSWIIQLPCPVACLGDHACGPCDNRTHRHLAARAGGLCLLQGDMHMGAKFHVLVMHRLCYLWQGAFKAAMGQA